MKAPLLTFREEYLWAATVLSSRSFPSRLASKNPGDADPAMSDPILIPIMDMLNHRPNHPVTWLASKNTITYIAETDYSAGDEIFNNYGAKCNEECSPVIQSSGLIGASINWVWIRPGR